MDKLEIKLFRHFLEMTQEEFADLIDCKTVTVGRWERGEFEPHRLYVKKIKELMSDYGFDLRRPKGNKEP